MKVAIIGSRSIIINNLGNYLPKNTTEIVSGGAKGVDTCARRYAIAHNIKLTEFLPDYKIFGRIAPLVRNRKIVDASDIIIAFWDNSSKGTLYTINYAYKKGKKVKIIQK